MGEGKVRGNTHMHTPHLKHACVATDILIYTWEVNARTSKCVKYGLIRQAVWDYNSFDIWWLVSDQSIKTD